jgi:hypothetical protein
MPYDIYSALIGEPPTEEEKLRALASQLRMRNNQGMVGQLTGDRVLAPFGTNLSKTANTQAEDLGQRGETARYRKYQEATSTRADERQRAEQAWREKNAIAEQNLERAKMAQAARLSGEGNALRLAIEKERAAAKAAQKTGAIKAGGSSHQKAVLADELADRAAKLKERMPEGVVNAGKDLAIDLTSKVWPGAGQALGEKMYGQGLDPESWRADADSFDQDVSNLAAGLAVTGFELENKQKWSPRAPGISAQEAKNRFDNMNDKFKRRAAALMGEADYYKQVAGPDPAEGGLSAEEQAELAALEAQFGGAQ